MSARRAGRFPAGGPRLWFGSASDVGRPGTGYPGALRPAPETVPGRQRLLEQVAMPRPSLPLRTPDTTSGDDVRIPLVTSPTTIEKQNGPGKPTPLATPPTYPGGSTALRRRPATPARPAGGSSRCRQATSRRARALPPG